MLDMLQPALEQVRDVGVVQRIERLAARSSHAHQPHLAQPAQLV
jgi:hypothetical protein